jgi:hypothetical protein
MLESLLASRASLRGWALPLEIYALSSLILRVVSVGRYKNWCKHGTVEDVFENQSGDTTFGSEAKFESHHGQALQDLIIF